MDAAPALIEIADALAAAKLEAMEPPARRSKSQAARFWLPRWLISLRVKKKRIVPRIAQFSMSLNEPLPSKPKRSRKPTKREVELEAMRHVWEQDLVDMIRANFALPMHKRTHFLRLRLPNGGSTL